MMMMATAVDSLSFTKVAVTSCLLFFICIIGLLPGNPTVTKLTKDGETITYPFYDRATKKASFHPTEYYHRKLSLWIKDFGHKLIISIFALIMVIRPDMSKWGFNLSYMWLFFTLLMLLDHGLFRSRLNWGFDIEVFLMAIQSAYTLYCWAIWKGKID